MKRIKANYHYRSKSKTCFFMVIFLLVTVFYSFAQSDTNATINADTNKLITPKINSVNSDTTKIIDLSKVANDTTKKNVSATKKMLDATFLKEDVELKKGDILSNVLRIVNNDRKSYSFTIELSHPHDWRALAKTDKIYILKPGDTLYVPTRLVPPSVIKGNTKFLINAFLLSEEDNKQLSGAFFFTGTKKQVKWELTVLPREKVYFKNFEKNSLFGINLLNVGNESEDILLTMTEIGRNMVISDTSGKIITKRYFDISLDPSKDTTMRFNMSYFDGKRNFKRIDNETYLPRSSDDEKRFTLFLKSTESKQAKKSKFTNGKKITFVKLSNRKKVNPYATAVIPLIMDANVYNILGGQPIMNLVLRGNTFLSNGANIVYHTQFNYNTYSFNKDVWKNSFAYLGYFDKKFDVQIGNVNGGGSVGLPVSGKGISGNYHINEKHTVGAFITRSPYLFKAGDKTSFGISHRFRFGVGKQLASAYGRIINDRAKVTTDFLSSRLGFSLRKKHQFGVGATVTRNENRATPFSTIINYGYLINANYSGAYLKDKLATNLRASYNSKNFSTGFGDRLQLMHRSTYYISKKLTTMLQNSYNTYEMPFFQISSVGTIRNTTFTNQLFLSNYNNTTRVTPSVFYNVYNIFNTRIHYRGIGLDYNYFNIDNNFRVSSSLRGGYNDLIDFPRIKEYFTLQFFGLCQYHNFSFNLRYNYGPQAVRNANTIIGQQQYPQLFYASAQYQYLFKDERFLLMTNINYSYLNQLYSHSFGIFPEIYFYSYNGWRIRFGLGYNASSNNRTRAGLYSANPATQNGENKGPKLNQNVNMSVGVRKEFGIPVPKKWTKQRFHKASFMVFMDINGNKIKDRNEVVLENVVIRLGEDEVLTDVKGVAELINVKQDYYGISVIPLVDLKGWFPLIQDSISIDNSKEYFIPFVKGVKLYGNVLVDRDQYVADQTPLDLSRIRITATDSLGKSTSTLTDSKGTFAFYVPYGKYTLTMDESLLGDKFALAQNNIEMELREGLDNLYNTFYIIEKRRKINKKVFKNGGN